MDSSGRSNSGQLRSYICAINFSRGFHYNTIHYQVLLRPLESTLEFTPLIVGQFNVAGNSGRKTQESVVKRSRIVSEVIEPKGLVQGSLGRDGHSARDSTAIWVEVHETMNQVKLLLADAAHLKRRMPKFLEELEEVLRGMLSQLTSLARKIDNSTS